MTDLHYEPGTRNDDRLADVHTQLEAIPTERLYWVAMDWWATLPEDRAIKLYRKIVGEIVGAWLGSADSWSFAQDVVDGEQDMPR